MALSLGSLPAGVTRRLFTVEPGLSSTRASPRRDRPAVWREERWGREVDGSTSDAGDWRLCYVYAMSQPAPRRFPDPAVETPDEREVRLAWERERIAEADADIAAGRVIEGDEALEWLDKWAAGEELDDPPVK